METKEFNFMSFVAGTNYPTDTVTIYQNADAAFQIEKLESQLARTVDSAIVAELENKIAELSLQFKKSRAVITMRGIPYKIEKAFTREADEKFGKEPSDEKSTWISNSFVAAHIISVEDYNGNKDTTEWTADLIDELFSVLTLEGSNRIKRKSEELTIRTNLFENVEVNPDF